MGQSTITFDRAIYTGTAAVSGGTFVVNFPCSVADQMYYLRARIYASYASSGHMAGVASLVAECIFENKNGIVTIAGFAAGSANPQNWNNASFINAEAQASDFVGGGNLTLAWTVSTPNAVLTFTNTGNANIMNCTAVIEIVRVGST